MKVLVVGGGGREHALGWSLARSRRVDELTSIPGNPGLAELGPVVEGIALTDIGAIAAMARLQRVDLVVVGPEAPLAAGIVDALRGVGVPVFGPTRSASRLESSKSFAKKVMAAAGVPTAAAETFTDPASAKAHLETSPGPYVVKADGLAAGKGVLVTDSRHEARAWVDRCFERDFGAAGEVVVVEEYLPGLELSVFAVCTANGSVPMAPARDYKRLGDGDVGPNTGGMGSYSPVEIGDGLVDEVMSRIIEPTLAEMAARGTPFHGFLYAGLALTADGPKVIEFNVRLGDPEAQVVLPRLESDLMDVLDGAKPRWSTRAAVNVVLAAEGYPGSPVTGGVIGRLPDPGANNMVFHAGTRRDEKGLVVAGGRVLNVVGTGETLAEARETAYGLSRSISWPGMQMRTDIGLPFPL